MKDRIAAIIVNYNMPERADALAEKILASSWPVDLILVDNGSDIAPRAKNTTLFLSNNCQTTGGWLSGVGQAHVYERIWEREYLAYAFIITSGEIVFGDPIASCGKILLDHKEVMGVHPALTVDSTTIWTHMKARLPAPVPAAYRKTWMIDNIFSFWRADFFDAHPFDEKLIYAHGIDLEICHAARKEDWGICIDESSLVRKITNIGYTMNRMNMSADQRNALAMANMNEVLGKRYGPQYWNVLTTEFVSKDLL